MANWVRMMCAALALCAGGGAAAAEPDLPPTLEMMVPWGPGGGADVLGRLVARWLESDLKVPAPVMNRPGAGGVIGLGKLNQGAADGHELGILTSDSIVMAVAEPTQLGLADMAVLAVMSRQPHGFYVRTDSRFRTWADVVAEAKARPGTISVATTGPNSPDDLAVGALATRGVAMISVPFAKPGERYAALLGGHVDLLFEQAGDIRGHLDGKAMRPLLLFAPRRLAAPFADVPVSAEFGYPEAPNQIRAVVVKAGTDPRLLARLAASLDRFATSPAYLDCLRDQFAAPDSYRAGAAAGDQVVQDAAIFKRLLASLPASPH